MRRLLCRKRVPRKGAQSCSVDDGGFTLIELLVAIVILPLIMGGLAAAILTVLRNTVPTDQHGTAVRLSNSHDAQLTSAYFVRDAQAAQYVSASSTPLCTPGGVGSYQLVGFEWSTTSNSTDDVSYFILQSPLEMVRYFCVNGTYKSTSVVSHDVFAGVPVGTLIAPSYTCTGTLSGSSVCADSPTSVSYVGITVVCSDGTNGTNATCADGTKRLVDPTASGTLGIQSVLINVQENPANNFTYKLSGTPRVVSSNPEQSSQLNPPFIANGPVNLGNCGLLTNGVMAVNDSSGSAVTTGPQGSATSTGFYTTGGSLSGSGTYSPSGSAATGGIITSPYDSLEPDSDNSHFTIPIGATYTVVTITNTNWDPSTDTRYETNGVIQPAIYVVTQGMAVSKGLSTTANNGALFYVTGGDVKVNGNGAVNLTPLTPNWEVTNPATNPPQPSPEVVLWVSKNDVTGSGTNGAPTLTLSGNGQATTIVGAVYAPTAQMTLNGGGVNSGVNVAGLDIGGVAAGNGCGNVPFNVVVGPNSFTTGMRVLPNKLSITSGQQNNATISVVGIGPRAPTGTVTVYECGPVQPGLGCAGPDPHTGNPYPMTQVGAVVNLTPGATSTSPSTGTSATLNFPPAGDGPGTYCFAATYSGDISYQVNNDETSDGCFTVSGPPAPLVAHPINGDCYKNVPGGSCPNAWLGFIDGTATDPAGPGLQSVQVAVQEPGGKWWSPITQSFSSTSPITMTATDTSGNNTWSSWKLLFPATNLPAGNADKGTYNVIATSTDTTGASGLSDQVSFIWKG